jgi:hypothetical protein
MNNFSIYYQVYNNIELTSKVLTTFRKIYPNVHIRLLCDSGIDYSSLSKEMNCEYIHSNYHMGLWGWNHKDVLTGKHCYGWNKEEGLEHIQRWYKFAKSVDSKYMLMMEDDIYITKPISIVDLDFSFTEVKPGNQLNDDIKTICSRFNINHTVNRYGCCGGHFINRELYIECVDKSIKFIENNYNKMLNSDFHLGWPDTLNNLIFNLCGHIGIENIDYHEGFNNPENKAIFHNYNGREEKWKIYDTVEK